MKLILVPLMKTQPLWCHTPVSPCCAPCWPLCGPCSAPCFLSSLICHRARQVVKLPAGGRWSPLQLPPRVSGQSSGLGLGSSSTCPALHRWEKSHRGLVYVYTHHAGGGARGSVVYIPGLDVCNDHQGPGPALLLNSLCCCSLKIIYSNALKSPSLNTSRAPLSEGI